MSDTIDCPKCGHEHEASGSHDDDSGRQTCDECDFEFIVDIEYEPVYEITCVVHEYREMRIVHHSSGSKYEYRECRYCGHATVKELVEDE